MPAARQVVVLGGGLAGSSVALRLARAGRRVVLLEKSRGPHDKVCGEFLSTEALYYLRELGVTPEGRGAVKLTHVRLASGHSISEAPLPFPAMSLSRKCLDEAMLQSAASEGVEVRREAHAAGLRRSPEGWTIAMREEPSLTCLDVFLATGKHDLHGLPRPAGAHSGLVGMKMYFRLRPEQAAELASAVELLLFPGGYAGLQPVEGGCANLCPLVDAATLRRVGSTWPALLAHMRAHSPHLMRRLEGAVPLLDAPLAISPIPYGHVQRETEPGLWRLGDQAAVIPSFSGDGMSIALHSAAVAADRYLKGGQSTTFQREFASSMCFRLRLATVLSRMLVDHPWAAHLAHAFPASLPWMASMTRIPAAALLQGRAPSA